MKKISYFLVVLVLSALVLVACGAKNPSHSNTAPVNNQTTDTTEFTYLPKYEGVKLTNYTPASTEDPFAEAEYLIPNVKDVQVYEDYKAILQKDGWTITDEMPVSKFSAKKDIHVANISIMISNNGVTLNVRSK